jgi:hypothetical protein
MSDSSSFLFERTFANFHSESISVTFLKVTQLLQKLTVKQKRHVLNESFRDS